MLRLYFEQLGVQRGQLARLFLVTTQCHLELRIESDHMGHLPGRAIDCFPLLFDECGLLGHLICHRLQHAQLVVHVGYGRGDSQERFEGFVSRRRPALDRLHLPCRRKRSLLDAVNAGARVLVGAQGVLVYGPGNGALPVFSCSCTPTVSVSVRIVAIWGSSARKRSSSWRRSGIPAVTLATRSTT